MRVTVHDTDSEVTIEPVVDGPKRVLFDHLGRPLKRSIGFTVDNREPSRVDSSLPSRRP